jgi:hypothetical protein
VSVLQAANWPTAIVVGATVLVILVRPQNSNTVLLDQSVAGISVGVVDMLADQDDRLGKGPVHAATEWEVDRPRAMGPAACIW